MNTETSTGLGPRTAYEKINLQAQLCLSHGVYFEPDLADPTVPARTLDSATEASRERRAPPADSPR